MSIVLIIYFLCILFGLKPPVIKSINESTFIDLNYNITKHQQKLIIKKNKNKKKKGKKINNESRGALRKKMLPETTIKCSFPTKKII